MGGPGKDREGERRIGPAGLDPERVEASAGPARAAEGASQEGMPDAAARADCASVRLGSGRREGAVARIRFEPMGVEVRVPAGRRVYDVAGELGLPLAQSCGGEGICGRCGVRVLRGTGCLSPEGRPERARKAANRIDPELRLACLTTVRGDVVVTTDYW